MTSSIKKIKALESPAIVVKIFTEREISMMQDLYWSLPVTKHNLIQKNIKKRWIQSYNKELDVIYIKRLKEVLGDFKMDNLTDKNGNEVYGLFHESFKPLPLHVDTGFNLENVTYKQLLTPLSEIGETVVFKNRWYERSTIFTINHEELKFVPKIDQNMRSKKHVIKGKKFDTEIHKKYLGHIDINNLEGMEIDKIYNWKIGETLIFDRTQLHSASSKIDEKKLGLSTFTKK